MKVKQRSIKTTNDPEAVLSLLPFQQDQHVLHVEGMVRLESSHDGSLRE